MRLQVQLLFLVLSTVDSFLDNFEYDVDDIDNRVDAASELDEAEGTCRCVAWSLCDENGYVITDGSEGLLSPRNLFAPTCEECGSCPSAHICCRAPPDEEVWPSWDTCGVNKYKEDVGYRVMNLDRLISQTQFAEFPWTLMVFRAQQKPNGQWAKYMFRGGASIIHPKIALTVAHILWDANETLITVRAGEWNASSNTEEIAHQDRGVQEIIIHPSFDKVSMYNDIALLILDRPFDIAENVAPICLPFPDTKYDPNKCLAAGWGTNRFGPEGRYSTTLRKVSLPLVPEKECEKKLKKSYLGKRFRLHYSFVCAGGKPGQDTCMGDGGGPLMCLNDDGAYVQVGIVSWGVECGTEYPAVYTNVSTFLHWIVPVIAKVGDTQP